MPPIFKLILTLFIITIPIFFAVFIARNSNNNIQELSTKQYWINIFKQLITNNNNEQQNPHEQTISTLMYDEQQLIFSSNPSKGSKPDCCYLWLGKSSSSSSNTIMMNNETIAHYKSIPRTLSFGEPYLNVPYWINTTNRVPLPSLKRMAFTKLPGETTNSFYFDCDTTTDRLQLRREIGEYDSAMRSKYLSRQIKVPSDFFDPNNITDHSKFLNRTVACTEWIRVNDSKQGVACTFAVDTSLQTRYSNAYSEVCSTRGSFYVFLTPPDNITNLSMYPSIHPLRYQSVLLLDDFDHEASAKIRGNVIPAIPVVLKSWNEKNRCLGIPPYWGVRILYGSGLREQDRSFELEYIEHTRSNFREAIITMSQKLPKMLQYGALENQPLWFGMWGLAVYIDNMFELEPKDRIDKAGQGFFRVVNQRWGLHNHFRRGYADDPLEPAPRAAEIEKDILDECNELVKTPKDLMLIATDRERMMNELVDAAVDTRKYVYRVAAYRSAVAMEMLVDQAELAIAETLSPAGLRPYFKCYWGGMMGGLSNHRQT
jgi:hypothetical protein